MELVNMSVQELSDAFYDESIIDQLQGCEVLAAIYETPCYEGYAFVLFEKNGELYEVNGSHCSCYGLEDQWEPTRTTWKALSMREFYGYESDFGSLVKELAQSHLN